LSLCIFSPKCNVFITVPPPIDLLRVLITKRAHDGTREAMSFRAH
jgi:hypothetical protein